MSSSISDNIRRYSEITVYVGIVRYKMSSKYKCFFICCCCCCSSSSSSYVPLLPFQTSGCISHFCKAFLSLANLIAYRKDFSFLLTSFRACPSHSIRGLPLPRHPSTLVSPYLPRIPIAVHPNWVPKTS